MTLDAHLDVREYDNESSLSSGTPFRCALETSSAKLLRSSPTQSTRGVRSFFGSALAVASGEGLASYGFGSAPT